MLPTQIFSSYLQRREGQHERRATSETSRPHEFTIRASGNIIQLPPAQSTPNPTLWQVGIQEMMRYSMVGGLQREL